MFRFLLVITSLSFIYVSIRYFKKIRRDNPDLNKYFSRRQIFTRCSGKTMDRNNHPATPGIREWGFCASILITLLSFYILAITGILPVLITGQHLSGILLITHVTVAPVFIVASLISILFLVHRLRLNENDWQLVKDRSINTGQKLRSLFFEKIEFWIAFIMVVSAILSIILMMYPIFDTAGQEMLLNIHRYSTLVLFLILQHRIYIHAIEDH